jgi:hypothetical protein
LQFVTQYTVDTLNSTLNPDGGNGSSMDPGSNGGGTGDPFDPPPVQP